jgi:hypothetical protein
MKVNVLKEAVKYGVIAGLITLLINYGAWGLTDTAGFVSITGIVNFIPFIIILLIVTGLNLRKANDNVLTFKDALKFAFAAYVIVALFEAVGTYVLYNLVDTGLTAKSFEIGKEKAIKMMQTFGASDQKIEEATKKMDKDGVDTGFKKIFLGMGYSIIWYFCKSLLLALVIRKEQKFED